MFDWPLGLNIVAFLAATAVITGSGIRLSQVADRLADRTGLGEALMGALLLGGSTSLAGTVVSLSAAWQGQAQLAISNAIGGIAAQTAFLAVADMAYRRANLEHAAASLANILFGTLVIALLGGFLMATASPNWTLFGIHPVTPILFISYLGGLRLARNSRNEPMWKPRQTNETREDKPDRTPPGERLVSLWTRFSVLAVVCQAGIRVSAEPEWSKIFSAPVEILVGRPTT